MQGEELDLEVCGTICGLLDASGDHFLDQGLGRALELIGLS